MAKMVQSNTASVGIRWYLGGERLVLCFALCAHAFLSGGIASALVTIALMGWLHLDLDKAGSGLIPRKYRLITRLLVAIFFALFPLAKHLKDIGKLFMLWRHSDIYL
jgi:hypothetical protein